MFLQTKYDFGLFKKLDNNNYNNAYNQKRKYFEYTTNKNYKRKNLKNTRNY